jgi:YbgC/YbaW family acyl-CoA thioester hydrolase
MNPNLPMSSPSAQSPLQPSASLSSRDFRFRHRLRVRWAEVDMQKIVFNGHYLMYFDTAVADYWRALALPYEAVLHRLQGDMFVKKASVEYHASARYDDTLDVCIQCAHIGNSSMRFRCEVFRGDEHLISGELLYVFADPATQTSRPVPKLLRDWLSGFEAGEPMVQIKTGTWGEVGEGARQLRTQVFIDEQRIPKEMEWDDEDAACVHAVGYNRLGLPVATGRLLPSLRGVAKIGRMAVDRVLRGSGLGRDVLFALADVARQRGDHQVELHAQRSAEGFYQRLGFVVQGEPFVEAGIAHIEMAMDLALK